MARARSEWSQHLSGLKAASLEYPFGPTVQVFKVGGKMFALLSEDDPGELSLKADPERSEEWRLVYPDGVKPGYHLNKRHWNTIALGNSVPDDEIEEMIQHSYDLIVASLPKAVRNAL